MKKILLLITLLSTVALCGCMAQKIPGKYGFYSTKSPSLSVKFNGLEYLGEFREKRGVVSAQTYYYSDVDGGQGAWVEIIHTREGWNVSPAKVPGEEQPNTGVHVREFGGDDYYCRTFIVKPGSGDRGLAALSDFTVVRICTRLISSSKRISIGYAGRVDKKQAGKIFESNYYGELTQEQKDFFKAFNHRADSALLMTKYQKDDLGEKIENPRMLENPWYKFTDFMSLKRQIRKVGR